MDTRCAQCNAPMTCYPEGNCWCAELPHGPMPVGEKGCLCPECLRKELQAAEKPRTEKRSRKRNMEAKSKKTAEEKDSMQRAQRSEKSDQ
jgi:hypothetical protein